jgi:predicted negative regulator of RcsB-dependent stress response
MDVYQTEEEQVESIKKWWAENARSIIFGIGLGLFGIFGWQTWKDQQQTHVVEASDLYQQLLSTVEKKNDDAAIKLASEIDQKYADTPYGALAGLYKAKVELGRADSAAAVKSLERVEEIAENNSIQHLARLRALRIRLGEGDVEAVIKDVDSVIAEENGINPGEFIGQYEEIKGDGYRLLGDVEKARFGYIAALRNATLNRRIIQLKLDDLGPPPAKFGGEEPVETTKANK